MNQTITIKCENCDAVLRQLEKLERTIMVLTANSNGKPSKKQEGHVDHDRLSVAEFAARINLTPVAIYKRIRRGQMPPHCVVNVLGRYKIDWTVFERSIKPLN